MCALSQASCENCNAAWCLRVQGTVTTTVSLGVSTVHDASATVSTPTASITATLGQQTSDETHGGINTTGAIVGGIVGGLILVASVAFVMRYCRGRYKIRIQRMEETPTVTKDKGMTEAVSADFVPQGGRHELDAEQRRRVMELEAHQNEMLGSRVVYEMDGRSRPGELG